MTISAKLGNAAAWSAITLGFAIPVSTAVSNLLLALVVLLFFSSGDYRRKFQAIVHNPAACAALIFVAIMALGSAYGRGDEADKLHYLGKYASLLIIPLLVPLFASRTSRLFALAAFCSAMLLTLVLSYSIRFGWPPAGVLAKAGGALREASNPVVFKLSITHGFLMAISAFLLVLASRHVTSVRLRWTLLALAALAAVNVLFMVIGRTGYVVLVVLGVYFFFCRFGRKGLALAVLGGALIGAVVYQTSDVFHERTRAAIAEAGAWKVGTGDKTSIGLRLDYYSNTLSIIRDHPWFGVGLGGFKDAYGEQVKGTDMVPSNNPHNQYLLITAQLGLFGLAALLGLYAVLWRQAGRLAPPFQQMARGVLLAFIIGNLFNSFMLDFTERMFFAWLCGVLFAGLPARSVNEGGS